MYHIKHWRDKNQHDHNQLRDSARNDGYVFLTLTLYGTKSSPLYAAIMIKESNPPAQRDFSAQLLSEFRDTIAAQKGEGWYPTMICATGHRGDPLFAGVFEKQDTPPLVKLQLKNGAASDADTIQGQNAQAYTNNLRLRWAASYGTQADPAFAGIWVPNSGDGKLLWGNDGVLESVAAYQARFDAEIAGFCAPRFVTLNKDNVYCSIFVGDEHHLGQASHDMTSGDYASQFDTWVNTNKCLPICVQAAGDTKDTARFAAIWVRQKDPVKRVWTASGPRSNDDIDNVIRNVMEIAPVRHASLSIVHGKQLVYARGYTLAEPNWPLADPTTHFRIGSVSKTVTALNIYQVIHEGKLDVEDKLQDILQLKTPAGHQPTDHRFKDIRIRHLLEHTSGIPASDFENVKEIKAAFDAANKPFSLPVSAANTDSFIATLTLNQAPGDLQYYNNCGYYLLGRVVKAVRNTERPIDAYQHLFDPLNITRIRRGKALVTQQDANEARYQNDTLAIGASVMSNDQPMVATDYGTTHVEIMEGDGGLSAATTDIARLIAIMISPDDNPAMPRSSILSLLNSAVTLAHDHPGWRAGYGLDGARDLGNGQFYGQKGGSIGGAHSAFQFNGDWGFNMSWGGHCGLVVPDWYPDFPEVMSIAVNAFADSSDLFPHYGMPLL